MQSVPIIGWFGCFMVFNATFNNISVISWWSVLLVEETGAPGENYLPAASLSVPIAVHFMYFGPSLRDHLYQKTTFSIFIWWSLKVKMLLNYHHPMRPPLL
jgi:hypothetical protein